MKKDMGRRFLEVLKKLIEKIIEKNLFTESAALSYYFALSMVPLIILLLSILSILGPDTVTAFSNQIVSILGKDAAEVVNTIISSTKESPKARTISEIIGLIVLLFSASSVFSKLKETLANIFDSIDKNQKTTAYQDVKESPLNPGPEVDPSTPAEINPSKQEQNEHPGQVKETTTPQKVTPEYPKEYPSGETT